jgi:hypothetical protein
MGGGQGKWALWLFFPTTEESLKNALLNHVGTYTYSNLRYFNVDWTITVAIACRQYNVQ